MKEESTWKLSEEECQKIIDTPVAKIEKPKNVTFELSDEEMKEHAKNILNSWKNR